MKIAVFCSANKNIDPDFFTMTEEMGKWMAENSHDLVFGDPQSDHMEYTLYVPAQVMPDMTLQLSNGENFVFLTNDTWKAGHFYSYSLKPVRNTLEVISATISPWTVESEKTINGYE